MSTNNKRLSPHYFKREPDGSVRLRLRLSPEEAELIEKGAGKTHLMLYIHRILVERAKFHIRKQEEEANRTAMDGNSPTPLPERQADVDGDGPASLTNEQAAR